MSQMVSIQTIQRKLLKYEVMESFNLFIYNPKRRNFKLKRFDVGDMIEESIKRRMKNPQRYLK